MLAGGGGNEKSTSQYDLMGRVLHYKEYDTTNTVVYSKDTTFDNVGEDTTDTVFEKRTDGTTWTFVTTYDYKLQDTLTTWNGAWLGGVVTHDHTHMTETGGTAPPDTDSQFLYNWTDSAQEAEEYYMPNATTVWYSWLYTDPRENLTEANIHDGQTRDVYYTENLDGEIVKRLTTGTAPDARYYYFGGVEMGDVSNDGTSNVNYAVSITDHKTKPQGGLFQNGATTGTKYADFDDSYDAVNGLTYEEAPSSYTVQSGDTLQSIAQQIWGDSNFWYLIADANGLDEGSTLVAGQSLIIPDKVTDNQNNDSTYKVYNPNDAIGDVSPTAPPRPQSNHSGCGVFGEILMVIVAVVVTALTYGAMAPEDGALLGTLEAGVVSGAAGGIASQAFGVATGIQKSFNWDAVALATISGGVDGGIDAAGLFEGLAGTIGQIGVQALQGAVGSAITQGIGVATGLQKSFNWAQVAAAGVSAGAMEGVGEWAEGTSLSSTAANALQSAAGLIAGAASRSLIAGTDFGDNIIKDLPDTIGQTVGAEYEDEVEQEQQDQFANLQQQMALLSANSAPQAPPPIDSSLAGSPQYVNAGGDSESVYNYYVAQIISSSPIRGTLFNGVPSGQKIDWVDLDVPPGAWQKNDWGQWEATQGTLIAHGWDDNPADGNNEPILSTTPVLQADIKAIGTLAGLFGTDFAGYASLSKALVQDLSTLLSQGYHIQTFNNASPDQSLHGPDEANADSKLLNIDTSNHTYASLLGHLAHEIGHGLYGTISTSSWSDYHEDQEKSEGRATLENIEVASQIHDATGNNIYIMAEANNLNGVGLPHGYLDYYAAWQKGMSESQAELAIGQIYDHGEFPEAGNTSAAPHSVDYYAKWLKDWQAISGGGH